AGGAAGLGGAAAGLGGGGFPEARTMRILSRLGCAAALAALLAGCQPDMPADLPPPQEPGATATGYICKMALSEHRGPKGQIFVKGQPAPLWFSSVRDTFTYLTLEEGNQQVAAVYVNDMSRADWANPQPGAWIEARRAVYVLDSSRDTDMGGGELVPFAGRKAADTFAAQYGGRVVEYAAVPRQISFAPSAEDRNHAQ
ncbi:MAG: nitrous oxide reductase accessory protein NosL, partial [Rhodospirillales bacterium]|nr:nitrous oxide reductase accessory protein NosL [Rhodospirillales bacterium]